MLGHNIAMFLCQNLYKKYQCREWAAMCMLKIEWGKWNHLTTHGVDDYCSLADFLVQYGLYCVGTK